MPATAQGQHGQVPIAVVGPTATGKSELALLLAERVGGEVINADAMQLYRGMDIGTAKLSIAGRRGIAHHQLDVLDVTEPASVAAYQRHATEDLHALRAAGRVPVIVGGSGLYVRSLLDDLSFPGTDAELRAGLERELADVGAAVLHERLRTVDPMAAESILPSNGRRIVRALEVTELTGRPFSATMPQPGPPKCGTVLVGLDTDPGVLDERVSARTAAMFAAGLVDEVHELLADGLRDGRTARGALGYRQVIDAIDGVCTVAEAQAQTAQATRRFVRRQRSWFRRDDRITWLDARDADLAGKALAIYSA